MYLFILLVLFFICLFIFCLRLILISFKLHDLMFWLFLHVCDLFIYHLLFIDLLIYFFSSSPLHDFWFCFFLFIYFVFAWDLEDLNGVLVSKFLIKSKWISGAAHVNFRAEFWSFKLWNWIALYWDFVVELVTEEIQGWTRADSWII